MYQHTCSLVFLYKVKGQLKNNLSSIFDQNMYAHALKTILSVAYVNAMINDQKISINLYLYYIHKDNDNMDTYLSSVNYNYQL